MAPACASACFTGIAVAGSSAALMQAVFDLVDRFKAMLQSRSDAEEILVECSECGKPLTQKKLNKHLKKHSDKKVEEIKAAFSAEMELQLQAIRAEMAKKREKDRAEANARLKTMLLKVCPNKGCDEEFLSKRELRSHMIRCHWGLREPKLKGE
ncbi:hypothetical protein ZWY2020_044825 [Hordeum vulgare]|nr:hypothetical protein ZWY2020_044825 [Hordeum vulgare]